MTADLRDCLGVVPRFVNREEPSSSSRRATLTRLVILTVAMACMGCVDTLDNIGDSVDSDNNVNNDDNVNPDRLNAELPDWDPRPLPLPEVEVDAEGFTVRSLRQNAVAPVVAPLPDGRIRLVYIDSESNWPMVAGPDLGGAFELPGTDRMIDAVTAVASRDGTLHIVVEGEERLEHIAVSVDGEMSEPQSVTTMPGRHPTVALAPNGDLVVAFTSFPPPELANEVPPDIKVIYGRVTESEVSFDDRDLVIASAGCCISEWGGVAYDMSGPSLAVAPDGSLHIVYEWQSAGDSTIEYIHNRGGAFSSPVQITSVAFFPCPSITADNDRTDITYVPLDEYSSPTEVRHARIEGDTLVSDEVIWDAEQPLSLALMTRDSDGVFHLAVTSWSETESHLDYITFDGEVTSEPQRISTGGASESLEMTPRAGGIALSDGGGLLVPFTRFWLGETPTTTANLAYSGWLDWMDVQGS